MRQIRAITALMVRTLVRAGYSPSKPHYDRSWRGVEIQVQSVETAGPATYNATAAMVVARIHGNEWVIRGLCGDWHGDELYRISATEDCIKLDRNISAMRREK
jgi:hypothetical protein